MITLDTNMPGKKGFFKKLKPHFKELGFHINGDNKYQGHFNGLLSSQDGEKMYLYLPYQLLQEEHNQPSVQIEFGTPLIIYHGTNEDPYLFQSVRHKQDWKHKGEQAVQQIINHIDNNL
ncbi:YugN family protein [Oceanobacillus sp. CFH 90083]|uniref:YugN family protein n=1 Tax=Oceanobacillus sp. CFH 90083 TaxID=2592336 RepID=UPI0018834AAD|nr:YugN family protein [Oceanobacillus sp. CFH 90083]